MNDIFVTENFLLQNDRAVELYHRFARDLPIIDYHCHLPPRQIADDHRFANLTQIWLYGDHYKWRAMRTAGVAERYCTGDASDWEKFEKWAEVVPRTLRNPLYHWTQLELKRPLGISDRLLNPQTARSIWDDCNARLARDDMTCRGILRQMRVEVVCTTDDPLDSLEEHVKIAADAGFSTRVLPTFRPDRALAIDVPETFNHYVDRLAELDGIDIGDALPNYLDALRGRHNFFHLCGCRLSDHGLETMPDIECTLLEATGIFSRVRRGERASAEEVARFRSAMLHEMALWDHARGWTQQFHIGALRNNNSRMFASASADIGFDSIADVPYARGLARFLDRLDRTGQLAKTILYNLNPSQNEVMATMIGNFQDGSVPGKDAVRQRLVVPRPEGRNGEADQLPVELGLAEHVRRHADRQPILPLLHAARVLPPHSLQPARHGDAAGPRAGRHRAGRRPGPRRVPRQRGSIFRLCRQLPSPRPAARVPRRGLG